jgi:hypothetical protein
MGCHCEGSAEIRAILGRVGRALGSRELLCNGRAAIAAMGAIVVSCAAPAVMTGSLDPTQGSQPPAAIPMCMDGEPGCIETGWGPGWDLDPGKELRFSYPRTPESRDWALRERALRAEKRRGECKVFWESDNDLGSAPVGACGRR